MKRILIILIGMTTGLSLAAQDNAGEIMEKSRELMRAGSYEALSVLTINDGKGRSRVRESIIASKTFDDGTDKRYIRFLAPADIKGTAMLIYDYRLGDDDMWIYLPALKRTRRIISREKGRSFMGSEFSNSDMSSPDVKNFTHSLVDETTDYWEIRSEVKAKEMQRDYGYIYRVSRISKKDYSVMSIQFFGMSKELFKTIDIIETYKTAADNLIVTKMTAQNHSNGRSSELVMKDIVTGATVDNSLFTVPALSR